MCKPGTTYVAIAAAAKELETTEMRILMMLRRNELKGRMEGDAWFVERSSLQACTKPTAADFVRQGCGSGCGGCGGH
ncbi:MAG TPA: hypothetical protein VF795_04815 [Desulfuromonadaceae bacterium]